MSETELNRHGIVVRVDPHRCISLGKCAAAAPGIYVLNEDTGIAELVNEDIATIQQVFAGAHACPTRAISIEQYGRRVFPQILEPMFGDKPDDSDAR